MSSNIPQDVQQKLKHQFLVIRQQAIESLVAPLKDGDASHLDSFQQFAFELLKEESWQSKQSAFILAQHLIEYSDEAFMTKVIENGMQYFEYVEHRVREAVADCMGECAKHGGLKVYLMVKTRLFELIQQNFSREEDDDDKHDDASGASSLARIQAQKQQQQQHAHAHAHQHQHNHDHCDHDHEKDASSKEVADISTTTTSSSAAEILKKAQELKHDTEGWKCLFSAMKTVERIIVGLGTRFETEVTTQLLSLLARSTKHINRFIREIAYHTYAAICNAISYENTLQRADFGERLALIIFDGLSDNWSQVRYASSHAVRNFFAVIPDPDVDASDNGDKYDAFNNPRKKKYFEILLPPMCLNRYYVAAGVRVYSLETWKLLVGNNGRRFVAEYMPAIQAFFISQAGADNHAVREAACHCIAELATKIEHDAVRKYIPGLLDALIGCFKDASWPVRDAACIALGDFVSQFPEESVQDLPDLYKLWFEHLSDNIPSVREDTALALGKILSCEVLAKQHGAEERVLQHIKQYIHEVSKQKSDEKYGQQAMEQMNIKFGAYENVTTFGVAAKRIRDNDDVLHSGQQQYSCGSLAPKLKKATRSGCMDHGFTRDRQPWEYTDGCVHLLKELIVAQPTGPYFDQFIPILPTIASKRNFAHYHDLQQTIWKCVPLMAEAVGKRKFKMYLELLLVPMIETLQCNNRLAMNAAGNCVTFCNKFIGTKFFLPRLKPDQLEAVQSSQFVQL